MSSEPWQSSARFLSSRSTQVLLLLGLSIGFVIFRWVQRLEPWNSDDMELFQFSVDAASGRHWLFGSSAGGAEAEGTQLPHTAFRIGLLPVTVPVIRALGANATAYYLVPLLFSLLGFCVLYWVLLRHFGPLVALVFGAIHVAWPFELEHASVLLTDLPSAAMALVSLCLLDAAARQGPRGRIACALLAGLAAVESLLLRNNSLVLLAPAYLVFFCFRSTRMPSVWAGAVILLGVLGQQAFLVYRGLGWGDDWRSVRADFAEYSKFLPVYSWPAFLVRQFRYQVSTFGSGFIGMLAALLVAGSLALHLWLLCFERRVLLLAIAAFGLFTWLVFSFSIYELVAGGVRAMVPVNFRFIQPFTYSSLVVWAWAWCALRKSALCTSALPMQRASAALPLLLIVFSYVAAIFYLPQTYRQGGTRQLTRAIQEHIAPSDEPLHIAGTSWSLQVPRVFCCAGSPRRVEWRELFPRELGELVGQGSRALVLRDIPRELELARYFAPEARQAYRAQLERLEESLWSGYELEYVDAKYALFTAPRSGTPRTADVPRNAATVPSSEPPEAPLLAAPTCRVLPDSVLPDTAGTLRTLVPIQAGRARASCEYTWLTDGLVVSALDPPSAPAGGSGFVLRLNADYEPPLSLSVEVVEYAERGVRRQRTSLSPGTSYVPVPLHAGTRTLFLVYHVRTRGALDDRVVRVRPVQWRPQRFLDGQGDRSFEAPTGDAPP